MTSPASRFLSALFGRYPAGRDDLRIEIRPLLPESAKAGLARDVIEATHRSVRRWYLPQQPYLDNAAAYAESLGADMDVYFGVLTRVGRSGSQDDVPLATCLFADVDGGDEGVAGAVKRIKEADVDLPDVAVQSGGGIHGYWLLDTPVPLPDREARQSFKKTLRRLCLAIGGASPNAHADPAAAEVARILRVPGTFNHKIAGQTREVRLLRCTRSVPALSRSYDWWRAHLPMEPEPLRKGPVAHPSPYTPVGTISPGLEAWARRGYPEGKRHQDFAGAAAWLVRDVGLNKADAANLLRVKAEHSPGRRAITAEEIEGVVKWA